MRIYLTGATGFVGRAVLDEALNRGHDVVAVVRPAGTSTVTAPAGATGTITEARVDLRSSEGLVESD